MDAETGVAFGAGCASAGTGALSGAAFAWLSSCVESEAGHSGLSASGSGADAKAGSFCAGCAACASAGADASAGTIVMRLPHSVQN